MTELKGFNLAKVEKRIDWTGELFSFKGLRRASYL